MVIYLESRIAECNLWLERLAAYKNGEANDDVLRITGEVEGLKRTLRYVKSVRFEK